MTKQPLTIEDKLDYLLEFKLKQEMRNYRLISRLKAIEAMMRGAVPESKVEAWDLALDKETQNNLQKILNACEAVSPGHAAQIDDREAGELALLD